MERESTDLQSRAISNYFQQPSTQISWIPITTSTKIPERDVLYSYPFGYLSPPLESKDNEIDRNSQMYHKEENNYSYGPPSPSAYSNGGYGEMQNSVAFTALGLMSFLFFLRMITDTINSLNGGVITPISKRNERKVKETKFKQSEISLEKLGYDIIQLCIELMEDDKRGCKPQQLCRTNNYLVEQYGTVGLVVGTLISETLIEYLYKTNEKTKVIYEAASRDGQQGNVCRKYFKMCSKSKKADGQNSIMKPSKEKNITTKYK